MAAFVQRKAQCLARADASRKGGLDERAAAIVQLLNGRSRFCTTSSCSGRLVLAQGGAAVTQSCGIQKTNCTWLLVTHETCAKDDVMTALEKATGDVVLKFEPFVLHVLCQELQDAQLLHSVAVNSGFRNSGITVGRGGKIMMAVRSTHCLEVPLSHKGKLMVSEEYLEFLIDVANQKMEENTRRIGRFYKCLELALEAPTSADTSPEETRKNHAVYTRRRKRKTIQEQEAHTSPEDHSEEPGPADDAETNLGPQQSSTCKYRWPSQTTPSLMSVSRRAVRAMELLASGTPETEKASCNRRLQPWKSSWCSQQGKKYG